MSSPEEKPAASSSPPAKTSGGGVVGTVAKAIGALDIQYTHNKGDVLASINTADNRINFMTGGNKRGRLAELDRLQRERASALNERVTELAISEAEIRQENLGERLQIEHEERVRRMEAQRAAAEATAAKDKAEAVKLEAEMRRKQKAIEALGRVGSGGEGAIKAYAQLLGAGSAVVAAGDTEITNLYDQLVDQVSGRTLRLDDGSSASINQLAGMLNMDVNSRGFELAANKILQQQGVDAAERGNIINSIRAGTPGVAGMGNGGGRYLLEAMQDAAAHAGSIKQVDEDTLRKAQETQANLDALKTRQLTEALENAFKIKDSMQPSSADEYDKLVVSGIKRDLNRHLQAVAARNQNAFGAPNEEPPALPGQVSVDPNKITGMVGRIPVSSAAEDVNPMRTAEQFDAEMELMAKELANLDEAVAGKINQASQDAGTVPRFGRGAAFSVESAKEVVSTRQQETQQQKILNDAEGMMRALIWQNPDHDLVPASFRQDLKNMRARGWWNLDESERITVTDISKALSVVMVEEYRAVLAAFNGSLTQEEIDAFRDKWYAPTQGLSWTPRNQQQMIQLTTGRELSPDGETEEQENDRLTSQASTPEGAQAVQDRRLSGAANTLGVTAPLPAPQQGLEIVSQEELDRLPVYEGDLSPIPAIEIEPEPEIEVEPPIEVDQDLSDAERDLLNSLEFENSETGAEKIEFKRDLLEAARAETWKTGETIEEAFNRLKAEFGVE